MEYLPVTPELPYTVTQETYTIRTEFENGCFQTRAVWPKPRRRFELQWHIATTTEAELLQAFARDHAGPANPFYYTPGEKIPRPHNGPTLGQTVGGALGARTRYAAFSWADATNETQEAYIVPSLAVSSGYLLTVTVPRFPSNVTKAWVYVGLTSATLKKQATAITTTAGTWTEPTGGYDSGGASPPTTNSLVETVTCHFLEDSMSFSKLTGVAWTTKATLIEVM